MPKGRLSIFLLLRHIPRAVRSKLPLSRHIPKTAYAQGYSADLFTNEKMSEFLNYPVKVVQAEEHFYVDIPQGTTLHC